MNFLVDSNVMHDVSLRVKTTEGVPKENSSCVALLNLCSTQG